MLSSSTSSNSPSEKDACFDYNSNACFADGTNHFVQQEGDKDIDIPSLKENKRNKGAPGLGGPLSMQGERFLSSPARL